MNIFLKKMNFATFMDLNLGLKIASNMFVRDQACSRCLKKGFPYNPQRKLHTSSYHCTDDSKENATQNEASAVTEKSSDDANPRDSKNLEKKQRYSKTKKLKHHNKNISEDMNKIPNEDLQKSADAMSVTDDLMRPSKMATSNLKHSSKSKSKQPTLWQSLVDSQMDNSNTDGEKQKEGLEITSMKNMKQPTRSSDEATMKLIMDVVAELNPEKGNIAKKKRERLDLSNKMRDIRSHKRQESPRDFESVLGEMKDSGEDFFSRRRQRENNVGKHHLSLRFTGKRHFFPNLKLAEVEKQEVKQQSEWSAMDWHEHYKSECDQNASFDLDKHFPWSAYDEMIRWTNEGKLWTFPINNEADMDLEADTPFFKHVFLEDKLNEGDWCPKQGPIRLFMTSVITALSSNPFLSVQAKHEHIEWFRDYFTERLDTLRNLGLLEQATLTSPNA